MLAVSSHGKWEWFYPRSVMSTLIFILSNYLVQPLALYEALARPKLEWIA